jgi:DNA-binding transcriptional LysR family regulator
MILQRLNTFAVAATHLNLRKAAGILHISQPSVSQQLRLLQEVIGIKLYTKVPSGIELTLDGRLFLKDAEAVLLQVEKLKQKYGEGFYNTETESLIVGGTYGPSANLLPSVLALFKRRHPHVQVSLMTDSRKVIENKVVAGEIEIAMINNFNSPPHLIAEPYGTMNLCLFAAKNHPIAKKKHLSLVDLVKTPFIVRGQSDALSSSKALLKQLIDRGLKPKIAMCCDSPDGVKMAVRRKLGVGILYEDAVRSALRRGAFKRLTPSELKLDGTIFIIYSRDRALSNSASNFLTLLRQWGHKRERAVDAQNSALTEVGGLS